VVIEFCIFLRWKMQRCEACLRQTSREGVLPGKAWVWGIERDFYLAESKR